MRARDWLDFIILVIVLTAVFVGGYWYGQINAEDNMKACVEEVSAVFERR